MSKTFQYANKHCVKLKTRFAWEKKKRMRISETSSFLVQCFFKVQARIFVQLIIFQALPSFLHKEYHSIFIPFRSQVYSKQGSPIFSLVWGIEFSIISPCLDKVFSDNWNLTNLFNIQFLSPLLRIRLWRFLFIWSGKISPPFKIFTTCQQEKSNHKKFMLT